MMVELARRFSTALTWLKVMSATGSSPTTGSRWFFSTPRCPERVFGASPELNSSHSSATFLKVQLSWSRRASSRAILVFSGAMPLATEVRASCASSQALAWLMSGHLPTAYKPSTPNSRYLNRHSLEVADTCRYKPLISPSGYRPASVNCFITSSLLAFALVGLFCMGVSLAGDRYSIPKNTPSVRDVQW
ncbi:hypothetical protein D3C75_765190 [compost metagenome]